MTISHAQQAGKFIDLFSPKHGSEVTSCTCPVHDFHSRTAATKVKPIVNNGSCHSSIALWSRNDGSEEEHTLTLDLHMSKFPFDFPRVCIGWDRIFLFCSTSHGMRSSALVLLSFSDIVVHFRPKHQEGQLKHPFSLLVSWNEMHLSQFEKWGRQDTRVNRTVVEWSC